MVELIVASLSGESRVSFIPDILLNAGWAGRDQLAVRKHIEELAQLGVPAPETVPAVFPVARHLLLSDAEVQVIDAATSAEVEYVLLIQPESLLVTVGSDHSDRALETHSVVKAKNACPNVMANRAWPWEEVADHFDQLELSCDVLRAGKFVAYQKGTTADLLPPQHWLEWLAERGLGQGSGRSVAFFSGTIPAEEGLVPGEAYRIRLYDPVLRREIVHTYSVRVLPSVGELASQGGTS